MVSEKEIEAKIQNVLRVCTWMSREQAEAAVKKSTADYEQQQSRRAYNLIQSEGYDDQGYSSDSMERD